MAKSSTDNTIAIDIGYSSSKIAYKDKVTKFPTAISYAQDLGIDYGDENVYTFEGEKYYVGSEAVSEEAFVTTDYKFLYKFAPLIIYHVLRKFDVAEKPSPIIVKTGLAIVDWVNKEDFIKRITNIKVNGDTISVEPQLIPQGGGVAGEWVKTQNKNEYPDKMFVLDIGYNTINALYFEHGKAIKSRTKSYPGHGVSSIIKPFTNYLETKFAIQFSEQEAIDVFVKGTFKYSGEERKDVADKIRELKGQFVKKLFQSVLVADKKVMGIADVVLIGGGGAYLLEDVQFPANVRYAVKPYEFANARGYLMV